MESAAQQHIQYHIITWELRISRSEQFASCKPQAPSNIIPSGTSSSVSTTQKKMIDTVLRRSHIGQLDATFGRFVEGCCLALLIQYRVSQNISRLRNTLAHWCMVCCFLTFLAWNGMSSLETSLLRVPCLLKWKENSHYSKCPLNFPGVSRLQLQISSHPTGSFLPTIWRCKDPSLHNWDFPTERKPRTGYRLSIGAGWRSWWASNL